MRNGRDRLRIEELIARPPDLDGQRVPPFFGKPTKQGVQPLDLAVRLAR